MINYIGLDAHSATCTFVTLDEKGKEISHTKVTTSEGAIERYLKTLKGKKHLTFEESGLSKWLYVTLKNKVDKLIVCNPGFLGKKQGGRTDLKDAHHLAHKLRCDDLVPVFHDSENYLIELRTLVSGYLDINQEIVRCKNRYKALFRSEALPTSGASIYSEPERIEELSTHSLKFTADTLSYQISVLEEIKSHYLQEFKANMKKHKILQLLDTMPGVSDINAHIIASITCDGSRFKSKHQYWSYCMLVMHIDRSDGNIYGRKIARGRKELKCVFKNCIFPILRGSNSLKRKYDRLRSEGVTDRRARQTLARDCAAIALAIMKTEKPYDDKYKEKKQRSYKKLN